jgi:hypothetical protein
MKQLIQAFAFCLLVSCTGHGGGAAGSPAAAGSTAAGAASGGATTSGQAQKAANDPSKMLVDTDKLKQDIGDVMRSMDAAHPPDTSALKAAASDILTTDARVLSDSGIDQLGDKNDPAAQQAQKELKKMRDAMGFTPAKLDSIRKAGASLH